MVSLRTLALSAAAALALGGPAQAQTPQAPAQALLKAELEATKLSFNAAHALSPDGRWLAYGASRADVTANR